MGILHLMVKSEQIQSHVESAWRHVDQKSAWTTLVTTLYTLSWCQGVCLVLHARLDLTTKIRRFLNLRFIPIIN